MRRLLKALGLLALMLLPRLALANACASNLAGGTGNWTTAGTWTSCGGVVPTATDTCLISNNDTVLIDVATAVCGVVTVGGTLLGKETSVGVLHRLDITADGSDAGVDLYIGSTGSVILRKNNRLSFNTNNGAGADTGALIFAEAGGIWDAQGSVFETTISAITATDADADAACGNVGMKYVITPAAGIGNAQAGGRVVFMSGPAEPHHLEIVSVAAPSFTVCTMLPDATSGTDTTGGQRLTPHAAFGGTHVFPVGRHSIPVLGGNESCDAASDPHRCCSGTDAGMCSGTNPAVGDKIAIVQDGWIYVSGATDSPPKGYRFSFTASDTAQPIMRAVNLANCGIINVSDGSACFATTAATNAANAQDFTFNNVHDTTPNGDVITFRGLHDFDILWNAGHDGRQQLESQTFFGYGSDNTCGATCKANNVNMSHNILYRTYGGALHLNQATPTPTRATNGKALKNKVFDSCTTEAGECFGIQADLCDNCLLDGNLIYDMTQGNSLSGQAFNSITGLNTASTNNWVVNINDKSHAAMSMSQTNTEWVSAVNNYVSHVAYTAFFAGSFYSNVAKNVGLANNNSASACYENAVDAKGNFCMPRDTNDTAHFAAADCDQAADLGCASFGVKLSNNASGNGNKKKATVIDNMIVGPFNSTDAPRGIFFDSTQPFDFNADVDHNTIDGRGGSMYGIALGTSNPAPAVAVNIRDNAALAFNNAGTLTICSAQTNVTDIVGASFISTGVTADKVLAGDFNGTPGDCTSFGGQTLSHLSSTFRERATLSGELLQDFNWLSRSPALTAGTSPAGSALGVRALRFNQSRITSPWSGTIVFDGSMPGTICNDATGCLDSDADGVINLHDNCDYTFNPSQYDGDADGKGNACDASP